MARGIRWSWGFLVRVTTEPKITGTQLLRVLASFVEWISECFLSRVKLLVVY